MSLQRKNSFLYKILSLFSVVRGYNVLVLVAAQYLAAIFIFSPEKSVKNVVFDWHFLFLIIASICVISAGYIINNFYDVRLDLINRPIKTNIDAYLKQETKLSLYFILNFIGFFFGYLISWRAGLFFAIYIFGIWLYSHKLKRYPITGLLSVTILTVFPFFAVFVYYMNFSKIIFIHASFLFLVILIRQLVKNLENLKGAIANDYKTYPVVYGENQTKKVCLVLSLLTLIPILVLFNYANLGLMKYYFYTAMIVLVFIGIYLWKSTKTEEYKLTHNILKILLLIGVLSLVFIDTSLLVEKVIDKLN